MKVLVVMPLARQLGGGELMLQQLLRHAESAGAQFTVVFLRDGPMVAEARAQGHDVYVVDAGRFRQPLKRAMAARRIAQIARDSEVDVILGWMVAAQPLAGVAALLAGVPSVWYQVGLPGRGWLDLVATAIPARGILVLSRAGGEAQRKLRPSRPQKLVYPGTSLAAFKQDALPTPAEARAQLGLPADGPLIGIVGRLQGWKGIHVLIEAMPAILARYPDVHAVIVGGKHDLEPEYEAKLARRISALGLTARVTLAGFQQNIPLWMQAMDVVVHASDNEPFGIVVIEAMALGKPVVAGARGGPAEVITEGVNGLLSPFGDAAALATAVLRYLDDPTFAAACGARARTRAADFSDERYAANVVQAIRDLIRD